MNNDGMADWYEDVEFQHNSMVNWKQELKHNPYGEITIKVKILDRDPKYQKLHIGDAIIYLENDEEITIELKTRKSKYEIYAETDVAIETKGVVGGGGDSAVRESNADLFGVGVLVDGQLKHVHIFDLKNGLKPWLWENQEKIIEMGLKERPTWTFKDGKWWQSKWIPLPLKYIEQFIIPQRYIKLDLADLFSDHLISGEFEDDI